MQTSYYSEGWSKHIRTNKIREHPDLERSTAMFGRLAENNGNAMAQILYGLALRFVPTNPIPAPH